MGIDLRNQAGAVELHHLRRLPVFNGIVFQDHAFRANIDLAQREAKIRIRVQRTGNINPQDGHASDCVLVRVDEPADERGAEFNIGRIVFEDAVQIARVPGGDPVAREGASFLG